jgi:hypothetical protein
MFKVQCSTKDKLGRHFHVSGIPETSKCSESSSVPAVARGDEAVVQAACGGIPAINDAEQ